MNIRKQLEKLSEKDYQKFSAALLPNINNVLGVRLPVLRKLSKEIFKDKVCEKFLKTTKFKYMEEYMLKGMVICLLNRPIEEILSYVKDFVPLIDNWSVCDSFCCGLKVTNDNLDVVFDFLQSYFYSQSEYEIRFAYVMLLNYYLNDEYIDRVLNLVDEFKDERYYSRMAVAWLISMCYVKYPNKTEMYLKKSKLDNWTFNKSIQKICESLKVDKKIKEKIKLMKK